MSGYLATPPVVDEARANWLRKYAAQHGVNLAKSYGYGDSHADASWLELVGTPTAVNPDLGLYSLAKKKRWKVLEW
jgi:phosphoserine phosphatase